MIVNLKQANDPPAKSDGARILVDRVWPRGVTKEKAEIDLWLKDLAPSTALRQWFDHDPEKWAKFKERYFKELDKNPDAVAKLKEQIRIRPVTLVYGSEDATHNDAVALREYLKKHLKMK